MATYWENSCSFGLRYVSWYKYLIVSLVFSHLSFWSGNLFLIAPFPGLCLLVPFQKRACRIILDYNCANVYQSMNDLKIMTISERIFFRKAKFMFKVSNGTA